MLAIIDRLINRETSSALGLQLNRHMDQYISSGLSSLQLNRLINSRETRSGALSLQFTLLICRETSSTLSLQLN